VPTPTKSLAFVSPQAMIDYVNDQFEANAATINDALFSLSQQSLQLAEVFCVPVAGRDDAFQFGFSVVSGGSDAQFFYGSIPELIAAANALYEASVSTLNDALALFSAHDLVPSRVLNYQLGRAVNNFAYMLTNPSNLPEGAVKVFKPSVLLATAAALPTGTYVNGSGGIGAHFTVTATGTLTVDGVLTHLGDRILVKDQVSEVQNGIYEVTQEGATGVHAVLTRTTESDSPGDFMGTLVYTIEGSANGTKVFACTNTSPPEIGTDGITYQAVDIIISSLDTVPPPVGNVSMNGHKITSLATPTTSTDATNKSYVDGKTLDSLAAAAGDVDINNHKITSLANGAAAQDAANVRQVQGNGGAFFAVDTGTANHLIVTLTPAPASYYAGLRLYVKVANNIGAGGTDINVNSLGVKSIKKDHATHDPGGADIKAGGIYELMYDGTVFQILSNLG